MTLFQQLEQMQEKQKLLTAELVSHPERKGSLWYDERLRELYYVVCRIRALDDLIDEDLEIINE